MAQPYYSTIAKAWHAVTGSTGGPLKRYVLNDLLIDQIGAIDDRAILELGAGNGYFARLLTRRRSGQVPARLVISDVSDEMLGMAERYFPVPRAEYRQLDVEQTFPFQAASFDLVVAVMLFNELHEADLSRCLRECYRVLQEGGRLLAAVVHPAFVARLQKNGQLSRRGRWRWTMPGKGSLRLPIVPRAAEAYERLIDGVGFTVAARDVYPTDAVLNERPGLRHASGLPLALVFECAVP